jgi:hypothetical protein
MSLQYTIEARELTSEYTHRPADNSHAHRTTVEASDADEAISRFVDDNHSELVSFVSPKGRESIATIKKNDSVYLVRVYAN